jgi:hypothetical protein
MGAPAQKAFLMENIAMAGLGDRNQMGMMMPVLFDSGGASGRD